MLSTVPSAVRASVALTSDRMARPMASNGPVSRAEHVLYTVGNLSLIVQVATIRLVVTRHRLAPVAAASARFSSALGFTAAHWLPRWSSISDPVWEIKSLTWFSYTASISEVLGALAVASPALR